MAFDEKATVSPNVVSAVSVHCYEKQWISKQATAGNLFVYHIAYEGVSLLGNDGFLDSLKSIFRLKNTYSEERKIAALVMRLMLENDWDDNYEARRRYFWAARTLLIALSADSNGPVFSSTELEKVGGISGLADHIDRRLEAEFSECVIFGKQLLTRFDPEAQVLSNADLKEQLRKLGGIAWDSVRIVEEREAISLSGFLMYG